MADGFTEQSLVWMVTQAMLEREIEKARTARAEHEGKKKREKRVIGFGRCLGKSLA